jgi:hypothetical protein
VNWFWRAGVTNKRSSVLLMQSDRPQLAGHWAAWLSDAVHVLCAYVGDVPLDEATAVVQNALADSMPLGLTVKNLPECTTLLADGTPVWTVFDNEFHRQKWEREDERQARLEAERLEREERRQRTLETAPQVGISSLGWDHLSRAPRPTPRVQMTCTPCPPRVATCTLQAIYTRARIKQKGAYIPGTHVPGVELHTYTRARINELVTC